MAYNGGMRGDSTVIKHLNRALKGEFTAIHQYIVHAEMCDNWGYTKLGAFIKLQAIGEMGHAEQFIERILFLEGVPGMGELQPLNVGQNVKEQLTNDLQLEYEAIGILNTAIKDSVAASDNASRELFERVLKDEEEHVDWLESQLQMIDDMGLGIYLSQQLADEAPAAG
ncbi:MAG: bacterioferritin [Bryobacterales bacterium]|nr:bacterioferritin [Bryobacterales bacterium]